jgi:hypothetical protein
MIEHVIEQWHRHMKGELPGGLDELLDDDVVFYSPIVFTPQRGKAVTSLYLQAAAVALPGNPDSGTPPYETAETSTSREGGGAFRYTKKVLDGDTAVSNSRPPSTGSTSTASTSSGATTPAASSSSG